MSGLPSWARVGAKVVYVGDAGLPVQPGAEHFQSPTRGAVYTINWTGWLGHQFCIGMQELDQDSAFDVRCFRPLISQQGDIATHFERLLDVPSDLEVA